MYGTALLESLLKVLWDSGHTITNMYIIYISRQYYYYCSAKISVIKILEDKPVSLGRLMFC